MAKTQNKLKYKKNKQQQQQQQQPALWTQIVDFNTDIVRRRLQSCSCVRIPFSFSFWSMAWAEQSSPIICSISTVVKDRRGAIEAHVSLMASASCWRVSSSISQLARLESRSFLSRSTSAGVNVYVIFAKHIYSQNKYLRNMLTQDICIGQQLTWLSRRG